MVAVRPPPPPPPPPLSASEAAATHESALRLAISDIPPDSDVPAEIARIVHDTLPEPDVASRPLLRALRDAVLDSLSTRLEGTDGGDDDARTVALRNLDSFIAVNVIGARAKISAYFDKLIRDTGWFRIVVFAGSSVAETAFLAVNHPKKTLTVIDSAPYLPGRALADKLAWQTEVPVRYAPLYAAPRAVEFADVVLLGAEEIMMNGSIVVAPGGAVVAQAAQESNVPVLVAAQSTKFSERVLVDWFANGDVLRPREVQTVITELETSGSISAPDVLKKLASEKA